MEADLEVLTALGEAQWAGAFKSLIAALKPALDGGGAMLLRVGRHSGAESVTLDRHRWIRIMEGPGKAHWAPDATTIWLPPTARTARRIYGRSDGCCWSAPTDLLTNDHLTPLVRCRAQCLTLAIRATRFANPHFVNG